ncbi:hypothetical protein FH972_023447 [Carpinus fangiana]|uniref:Uncharacterized protein n=1 Tax=Carpinus fangiana TaxID=176857 RepID=A0A5N6KXH7_9ROSI|nr:hypothetical protein FH972_023447 [Carpinus fangiana]
MTLKCGRMSGRRMAEGRTGRPRGGVGSEQRLCMARFLSTPMSSSPGRDMAPASSEGDDRGRLPDRTSGGGGAATVPARDSVCPQAMGRRMGDVGSKSGETTEGEVMEPALLSHCCRASASRSARLESPRAVACRSSAAATGRGAGGTGKMLVAAWIRLGIRSYAFMCVGKLLSWESLQTERRSGMSVEQRGTRKKEEEEWPPREGWCWASASETSRKRVCREQARWISAPRRRERERERRSRANPKDSAGMVRLRVKRTARSLAARGGVYGACIMDDGERQICGGLELEAPRQAERQARARETPPLQPTFALAQALVLASRPLIKVLSRAQTTPSPPPLPRCYAALQEETSQGWCGRDSAVRLHLLPLLPPSLSLHDSFPSPAAQHSTAQDPEASSCQGTAPPLTAAHGPNLGPASQRQAPTSPPTLIPDRQNFNASVAIASNLVSSPADFSSILAPPRPPVHS